MMPHNLVHGTNIKKNVTSIFRVKRRETCSYPPLHSTTSQKTPIFILPQTAKKDYLLSSYGLWSDVFCCVPDYYFPSVCLPHMQINDVSNAVGPIQRCWMAYKP